MEKKAASSPSARLRSIARICFVLDNGHASYSQNLTPTPRDLERIFTNHPVCCAKQPTTERVTNRLKPVPTHGPSRNRKGKRGLCSHQRRWLADRPVKPGDDRE